MSSAAKEETPWASESSGPETGARRGTEVPKQASDRFATFIAALSFEDLPADVVSAAKLHALDTVGCGLAAYGMAKEALSARASIRVIADMGGATDATAIGLPMRLPAANVALGNAALAHSLDYDDNHTESRVHVSSVIVPVALAVGEQVSATGKDVIVGLVAGNEIATRIGMGGPRHFQLHGFHGTPVCGVFGAAASASRLRGLDAASTADALGIAGDMTSGVNAWMNEGTTNKHLHPGWAAHGGIMAAHLAQHGAEGPPSVFEGRFGVYEALLGAENVDLEPQLASLGQRWETPRSAYKPYPACHFVHACLDSAAEIRGLIVEELDEIASIEVMVPGPAVPIVLEPVQEKLAPDTGYAGKFSLQYSVAAMLIHGKVDLGSYTDEAIGERAVLGMAQRVRWRVKSYDTYPGDAYPGGVHVTMRDGREFTAERRHQRGGPQNPMSSEQIRAKFRSNARFALPSHLIDELERGLLDLESVPDVRGIAGLLSEAKVQNQ